jgi:hypothetical protein
MAAFELDYIHEWEDILDANDIISFVDCDGTPSLSSRTLVDNSSSDIPPDHISNGKMTAVLIV